MKIDIAPNSNSTMIMRRAGYGQIRNGSFARRLGRGLYPRFHVYVEDNMIKLHLDQKQASYEGSRAHSGEHDSEVVTQEGERIRQVMMSLQTPTQPISTPPKEEKKGFFGGLFG
jgi:hypothetical protein